MNPEQRERALEIVNRWASWIEDVNTDWASLKRYTHPDMESHPGDREAFVADKRTVLEVLATQAAGVEDFDIQVKAAFVAGLRHAAEISGNEDCDQEEHCCVTVDRIVQSIESEAQKIEKGE